MRTKSERPKRAVMHPISAGNKYPVGDCGKQMWVKGPYKTRVNFGLFHARGNRFRWGPWRYRPASQLRKLSNPI